MLDIIISPNPCLLQVAKPCKLDDPNLANEATQMQDLMYKNTGIGLAGPQVGLSKRVIVIDKDYDLEDIKGTKNPITLINPEIVEKSDEMVESEEGCLSCPGISAPVMRHKYVKVKYFDLDGNVQYIEGEGTISNCLQHEIDHLDGKTLFQTAKPDVRLQLIQEYQQANT